MCGVSVTVMVTTLVLLLDKAAGVCEYMDGYQPWNHADPCVSQCSHLNSKDESLMWRPRNNFCCNLYNFDCILDCKKLERSLSESMDDAAMESVVSSAWEDAIVACECERRKQQELEMQQPLGKQQSLGNQQSLGKQATLVSPRMQTTSPPQARTTTRINRRVQPTSLSLTKDDTKIFRESQPTSLPLARVDSKMVRSLQPTSPPVAREAAIIARSVGLDLADESFAPSVKLQNLRVVSETRGEDTVSVLVAWEPVPSSASGLTYQVSWQPEEDVVRGNLITDTPSTTLSLLPDTIYDLKISVAGPDAPVGRLVVDTHPSPHSLPTHTLTLSEETAGAAAALILLMGLLFAVMRRNTRAHAVKEQLLHSDHFKEFPPPVTLLVGSPPSHESSAHLV